MTLRTWTFGLPHQREQAQVWVVPVPLMPPPPSAKAPRTATDSLEASWQVDLFDLETGHPWKAGLFLLPEEENIRVMNQKLAPSPTKKNLGPRNS